MVSMALRRWEHQLSFRRLSLKNLRCPSSLLPSAAARLFTPKPSFLETLISTNHRHYVSTTNREDHGSKNPDGFEYGKSGLPIDLEVIVTSRRQLQGTEWGLIVDAYLPLQLRQDEQSKTTTAIKSISTLPQVLSRVREQSKIDVLSYLGVHQGRWEAVMWLVQTMLHHHTGRQQSEEQSERLLNMLWPSDGQTLDDLTSEPILVESPGVARISLDSVMHESDIGNADTTASLGHRSLGQIWQSLGTMILQAADRSADDPKYAFIMTQVFRILGHLHRVDAFPALIYNYNPPTDQTALQRPPTLYLLSRRIMSTLSDIEFDIQWKQEISKYHDQGYELPKTSVAPRVQEFGPELWLDLVLWACVEGGWIMEGAWIVGEMERRKANRDTRWSVISWEEICARKASTLDWPSILRLQIDRTRLNQVGSINIATGSDSTVDMGTRTISHEVVLALVDGLLNIVPDNVNGESFFAIHQRVNSCESMLQRDSQGMNAMLLNGVVLRMTEATGANQAPGLLQQILDIKPTMEVKSVDRAKSTHYMLINDFEDASAILGLHHRNLHSFAEGGKLQGSLKTFRKIQAIVDSNRSQIIEDFASELKKRLSEADACDEVFDTGKKDCVTLVSPAIPVNALSSFLDLITESKLYDLGRWLLQNEDIDGGIIDPALYSDHNLQPALLRFATATADRNILTKILTNLEKPIPDPVMHALFNCQIVLGKWSAVEELLEQFKRTPGMSWNADDAMAIARTILLLSRGPKTAETKEQIFQACTLLHNLLGGRYNTKSDPSQLPDLSQAKLANQLGAVFRTLPGNLRSVVPEPTKEINRAHASVTIPSHAFNTLLETVVECHGPSAGRRLWQQWCHEPAEAEPKSSPTEPAIDLTDSRNRSTIPTPSRTFEKVVTPTRQMLRNILRPILMVRQRLHQLKPTSQEDDGQKKTATPAPKTSNGTLPSTQEADPSSEVVKRELTREEQHTLNWGIGRYKQFGLTAKEILDEIPGAVATKRR